VLRRTFTFGLFASAAVGFIGRSSLRMAMAETSPPSVSLVWNAARDSDNEVDRFVTTITLYGNEGALTI
jgi:hypothetical protein